MSPECRSRQVSLFRVARVVALLVVSSACFHRGVTPIRTHFNKGVYHYSEGDFDAAISEYRLALADNSADHRARFNLAEALEAQADRLEKSDQPERAEDWRAEAEEHYTALLAADPAHLRANVNLAARELIQGDTEAADQRLRTTIAHHPRSTLPRAALAAHRLRSEDPVAIREAAQLLEEALRRDPGSVDAGVLLGHAYATLARTEPPAGSTADSSRAELLGKARKAYRQALASNSNDIGALLALARLERAAERPREALPWLRRALYVNPDLAEAHLALSEILAEAGDLEKATVHLWRSRQLEESHGPQLTPAEYSRRLLDLYRRLAESESGD